MKPQSGLPKNCKAKLRLGRLSILVLENSTWKSVLEIIPRTSFDYFLGTVDCSSLFKKFKYMWKSLYIYLGIAIVFIENW